MSEDNKNRVYREAWETLKKEIESGKTSWGRLELQKRMQEILIAEMERYL